MTQITIGGQRWGDITPRAWQAAALPEILDALGRGERTVVAATPGSGKSILIAEVAHRHFDAGAVVISTPTQALVEQLAETVARRCGHVGRYYTHEHDAIAPVIVTCNDSAPALARALRRPVALWIADEVHRTEADGMHQAADALAPARAIGFSATPFRSADRERLRLWESVCYRYSLGDAIRDGVCVPWRAYQWHGDPGELDAVCLQMIADHARGPGAINARTIDDADAFANRMRRAGRRVETVHSRNSRETNALAVSMLEHGGLDAVVYVSMLSEGVDLPWLRWLCLRRQVGARVRFVQEIGRVIRAAPGKDHAVILDPHDLMGTLGWSYAEALGEWQAEQVLASEPGGEASSPDMAERYATHVDEVTAYCRRLLLPMQAAGLTGETKIQSVLWRHARPSDKAVNYLRGVSTGETWRRLPGAHSVAVRMMIEHRKHLTAGAVSDLIDLLRALDGAEYPARAADVDLLDRAALDRLARGEVATADDTWYAAGVWRKGGADVALSAFHGGRAVATIRRARHPDETWTTLQLRAIYHAAWRAHRAGDRAPLVAVEHWPAAAMCWGRKKPTNDREREVLAKIDALGCRVTTCERDTSPATLFGFRALGAKKKSTGA